VPKPRDAKWALSDARRQEHGAANARGARTQPPLQLEARPPVGSGESRTGNGAGIGPGASEADGRPPSGYLGLRFSAAIGCEADVTSGHVLLWRSVVLSIGVIEIYTPLWGGSDRVDGGAC
jgi:hypothetical protein